MDNDFVEKEKIRKLLYIHLFAFLALRGTTTDKEQTLLQCVSRKAQNKDVYRRTIEILQHACIFKANFYSKFHNAHLKLASSVSGFFCTVRDKYLNAYTHISYCFEQISNVLPD